MHIYKGNFKSPYEMVATPDRGKYSWNWAEMDSNIVRIILTFGVGAVWKEIENAHVMREISSLPAC